MKVLLTRLDRPRGPLAIGIIIASGLTAIPTSDIRITDPTQDGKTSIGLGLGLISYRKNLYSGRGFDLMRALGLGNREEKYSWLADTLKARVWRVPHVIKIINIDALGYHPKFGTVPELVVGVALYGKVIVTVVDVSLFKVTSDLT